MSRPPAYIVLIAAVVIALLTSGASASLTGSPSSVRYEAESATTNLPTTETTWTGYSGTGYVCCWNVNGQYATFTINAPAAGTYKLGFRYSAVGPGASRQILINGAITAANQAFPQTANWNTWSTLDVQATLNSGSNTVTVKFDPAAGSSQYVNLDFVDVTPISTSTTTPAPTTPTTAPAQPAAAAQPANCTAASYVCTDPASFPKMAEYLSVEFSPSKMSHFALNVGRGCYPAGLDQSHALNPNQVNLIVPGTSVAASADTPGPGCGSEPGFATTYGTGYWNDTSTITDSNPAIGTIRPINMAAGADRAAFTDGTTPPDSLLNLFSSGTNDSTAEWAARLKAHWTLQDLGGSFSNHPGVQGIWGDNFDWWKPYIASDRSSAGSSLAGTGTAWDNGLVRNAQVLRKALGSNVILGGNGAPWTCPTGASYSAYVGTITDGNCTAADAGMWEDLGGKEYTASAWDSMIPMFNGWIQAGTSLGRAKYGVIPLYGTCGVGSLGHPLTAKDERMGLALATIGGVDLWAVHDCDWSTTVVPGGQYSIPEMGDSTTYPRGWLGHPTAGAQRVALGEWKRTFSGGTVYANVTGSAWSVDGITVPALDATFVKS